MRYLSPSFILRFFPSQVIARFYSDNGMRYSAALSFSSLLALAPLLAIIFSVLSMFSSFDSIENETQNFLFDALLPSVSEEIKFYLQEFATRAGKLTAISVLAFFVTTLILLNNIEKSLNEIWRSNTPRPITQRLLIYWAMITLGPILMGASLSLSTYLLSLDMLNNLGGSLKVGSRLLELLPFIFEMLAFFLLYTVMPNTQIKWRYSLIGAFVAAVMFELSKSGFSLFIKNFGNYELIYGAFASLPIFLIWIYVSWTVTFLGAEVVAILGDCDNANSIEEAEAQQQERVSKKMAMDNRSMDDIDIKDS